MQCVNGSSLFLKVLGLLLMVHLYGGCTTLEHPRGTDGAPHPAWTIWMSSFVRRLLLDGHFQLLQILQGPLGKSYSKPTRLLVGRMPWLGHDFFASYDKKWRPSAWLGGKHSDGTWRTAEAKTYPPRMCQVLARSYMQYATVVQMEGEETDPEGLQDALAALAQICKDDEEHQMGADFQIGHFSN